MVNNFSSKGSAQASPWAIVTSPLPSKEKPPRLSQWICDWVTNWWGAELICWVIAASALLAIVVLLESHKDQPVPQWHFRITINSLISIFATISQMAMMKPLLECISQLKWLWFTRKEKLSDFEAFDNASRGPIGSLILLGKLRLFHLVSLGAAIAVLSTAFDSFTQQVVTYPLRLHVVGNATTPLVVNFTGSNEMSVTSPELQGSFFNGLASGMQQLSTVTPSCSTGNCTWQNYPSLGICASVVDVSSSISTNECNLTAYAEVFESSGIQNPGIPCFNYTLPFFTSNGIFSSGVETFELGNASLTNVASLDPGGPGLNMPVMNVGSFVSSSLLSTFLIYQPYLLESNHSSLARPIAYVLDLSGCVQVYNTTVSNGTTYTYPTSSVPFNAELHNLTNLGFTITSDTIATISVHGVDFGLSNYAFGELSNTLHALVADNCFEALNITTDVDAGQQMNLFGQWCDFGFGGKLLEDLNSANPLSAVNQTAQNIAISLTNSFRAANNSVTEIMQFEGQAFGLQTYVGTDYVWLTFPISLIALTLVFLLATISKSHRSGSRVWKSSNMATLQGLHLDLHSQLGGLTTTSEMDDKATAIKVRFDMEGGKAAHGAEYRLVESKLEKGWRA